VRAGALIVFPTDTVYGIAARADLPSATARLFKAKSRPRDLSLPVLVASAAEAQIVARFDTRADRLAAACWPGGLTLVLPRTVRSRDWDLGESAASIGVRVPAHPLALAVLAQTGPLATTSANRSGAPPATTCDELVGAFGDDVEVYLCQDQPLAGAASTVVSLLGPALEVVRVGALDRATIERLSVG
jgi:tRNA threonylcarbamoyl adenosine modification protein (Sua5/YciO/YrdC/YwlC family)